MDEISDQEAYHITNNRTYGDIVDPRFAPGVWAKAPAPTPSQFGDYKVARQKCWGDWNRASSVRDVRRAKISRDARGALFRGYASKQWKRPMDQEAATQSRFRRNMIKQLKKKTYFANAFRWYLENIQRENDIFEADGGFTDLQQVLHQDPTRWNPVKALGSGGYGDVVLWQRTFQDKLQQVAIKDATFDTFYTDYCAEAHLTRKLNAAGCKNIIKVIDWVPDEKKWRTRIAYEFCPNSDLQHLIRFYRSQNLTVPEPFVWHIFHEIATAICYNQYGTTTPTERHKTWVPILHGDIKPTNVFVSEPEDQNQFLYPTLKLGDYGLAYEIPNRHVTKLKQVWRTLGTVGFLAPEINQAARNSPRKCPDRTLSTLADVFSLGCLILDFLRLPQRRYTTDQWQLLDLRMRWSYKYYPYSKQLVDLALKCTQVDLNQRVPVQQLYEITKVAASKAFLPVWESANTREHTHATYNGLVLYSKALQSRFEQSNVFRENHRDWSDWFTVHEERHRKLADYSRRIIDYKWYRGKLKHLPKKGQVGIGNGLRRPMREAKLRAMNPHRQTAEWRKEGLFYTADGKASEHGEDPIYWYKGDDIIRPPHQWA